VQELFNTTNCAYDMWKVLQTICQRKGIVKKIITKAIAPDEV
jgi:hypothetical protein